MTNRLVQLREHVRLYGAVATGRHVFRALVRRIYRVEHNIVFIIPDFAGQQFDDPLIKPITRKTIQKACRDGDLSPDGARLLGGFFDEGSRGIYAKIDERLAGYAWVQDYGEYHFGRAGKMTIPPEYVVVKNLYVAPKFRGQRLGQKLNAARLAMIPPAHTPIVFIIPENRIAIRNWETHGFERIVEIKNSRWIGGRWQTRLKRLSELSEADELIRAIEKAKHA